VESGTVDFSYQNPYVFALVNKKYPIMPLVTTKGEDCISDEGICGEDRYRGVIITRHDSTIKDVIELKNKNVLVVSPKSAGGYLSQRLFLLEKGIDTMRDMKIIDAKRQENVILGVYRGEADAGFVRESALVVSKEEVDMKKIKILIGTNYLPNWPLASCRDYNPALVQKVKHLLIELDDKKILRAAKVKGFKEADMRDFETLKGY
jgi:ABC-type phosphate/phosphonate transport system substrate-binding protein